MGTKIFVGNLSYEATADDLREAFGTIGKVADVHLPAGSHGGNRGFGFVAFENEDDAASAVKLMGGVEIKGRAIRVDWANDKPDRNRERGGHARPGGRRWEG